MPKKFGGKPLVAEVIDLDQQNQERGRLSNLFIDRLDPVMGVDIDDPAGRFLYDDYQSAVRNRKFKRRFRKAKGLAASFLLGVAGAWLVWQTPGMGPTEDRQQTQQLMTNALGRLGTLETQLVQAQARVVDLAKTVEIQRDLLEQGETARRALASKADEAARRLDELQNGTKTDHERLELVAKAQNGQAIYVREQGDLLNSIREEVVKLDGAVSRTRLEAGSKLEALRADSLKRNREELQRFSKMLDAELAAIKSGDLNDVRDRVERLAEHVWQEVGRLDGRIVRAGANPETEKK